MVNLRPLKTPKRLFLISGARKAKKVSFQAPETAKKSERFFMAHDMIFSQLGMEDKSEDYFLSIVKYIPPSQGTIRIMPVKLKTNLKYF